MPPSRFELCCLVFACHHLAIEAFHQPFFVIRFLLQDAFVNLEAIGNKLLRVQIECMGRPDDQFADVVFGHSVRSASRLPIRPAISLSCLVRCIFFFIVFSVSVKGGPCVLALCPCYCFAFPTFALSMVFTSLCRAANILTCRAISPVSRSISLPSPCNVPISLYCGGWPSASAS